MNIREEIMALEEEFSGYRREMHQHPQTAYEETFAAELVAKKLGEWKIPFESGIATTGIVATIEGKKNTSDTAIGIRADMDALDIDEEHNKPWVSKIPGKMHGCGHDGHTAILLGTAKYLSQHRPFDGKVHLIFQPAEEGARGAHAMMDEGLFDRFPCSQVFAMHNWPHLPRGTMATRTGPMQANSDRFTIKVLGKGGHAAHPHKITDPVVVGSHIVTALQTLVSRELRPMDPAVISITHFRAGSGAFNVIADTAELRGTLRTYNQETRMKMKDRIRQVARHVAQGLGGDIEYDFQVVLDATVNDPQATALCVDVARKMFEPQNVDDDVSPSMGGEDFGTMITDRPGCYILLGQAEPEKQGSPHNHGLHTARYDFNDSIIPIGIEYWVRLTETALPLHK